MRIGITERHGMFDEVAHDPPARVEYCFPDSDSQSFRIIRSTVKGYMRRFEDPDCDLLEAVFSPIITRKPWILSTDSFHATLNFSLLGAPLPRSWRVACVARMLSRENFRRLILWSNAAHRELRQILGDSHKAVLSKAVVVYPAIRAVESPTPFRESRNPVNLLFSGDFFRKGGVNVLDAFDRLRRDGMNVRLRICCDEEIDFNTPDSELRKQSLKRIRENSDIAFGRVSRQKMMDEILPNADIYLLPTYAEAFGFALLEAMAHGLPVVSTTEFAIPEIVEHERSGFLIDTSEFRISDFVRGYVVRSLPDDFREHVSNALYKRLARLVDDADLRRRMGERGRRLALSKFSVASRNQQMVEIYRNCLE